LASYLRRGVALGDAGFLFPTSPYSYLNGNNPGPNGYYATSGTVWCKLWVDLKGLYASSLAVNGTLLANLDNEIRQAKADGRKVMLSLFKFPDWLTAQYPNNTHSGYRAPVDITTTSPWGQMIAALVARYSSGNRNRPDRGVWIDVLEILNEPNHSYWEPVSGAADRPMTASNIAAMISVACGLARSYGGAPMIGGPGTHDASGLDGHSCHAFTVGVLQALANAGFANSTFIWTHHCYTDFLNSNTARVGRAVTDIRDLSYGLAGWPTGVRGSASLFLTEGGSELGRVKKKFALTDASAAHDKQASLLSAFWGLINNDTPGGGAGVAAYFHYLFMSSTGYDTGLCDVPELGGNPLPAFYTWQSLPVYP
jgi:hypothetical protein